MFSTAVADVDTRRPAGCPRECADTAPRRRWHGAAQPVCDGRGRSRVWQQEGHLHRSERDEGRAGDELRVGEPRRSARPRQIKTDTVGHHHMPTPYVLRLVGDAFAARDIRVHFDVGDLETYRTIASHCIPDEGEASCTPIPGIVEHPDFVDDYTSHEADAYLITTGARGGEVITETACDPGTPSAPKGACHFPDYPGAVPWKLGLQAHRDGPVDAATGHELRRREHVGRRAPAIRSCAPRAVQIPAVRALARQPEVSSLSRRWRTCAVSGSGHRHGWSGARHRYAVLPWHGQSGLRPS